MSARRRNATTLDRGLYYASKFTAQAAQNLLLATLFVTAGTSSAAAIGISSIFVAILVPAILLGPMGGALVDRLGPARGLLLGAVLRLAPILAAIVILDGPTWAWAIAFAYSAGSQVFTPAEMALVRTIQGENPGRAHSLLVALQYAGQGAGMLLLAPPLYMLGGAPAMLAGAAVGFVAVIAMAAVLLASLGTESAPRPRTALDALNLNATVRFLAGNLPATYAVAVLGFKTIVSRTVMVALPFYLARDIGMEDGMLVYLLGPGIVGVGVGLIWSGRSLRAQSAHNVMRASLAGMVIAVFALAALDYGITAAAHYSQVPPVARLEASMNTTFAVAVPVAFLLGLVLTTSLIAARAALTEAAPPGHQARVFALQETLSEALVVAPLLLVGIGTQVAGARPVLAVAGALGLAAFLALEVLARRPETAPSAATGQLLAVPAPSPARPE